MSIMLFYISGVNFVLFVGSVIGRRASCEFFKRLRKSSTVTEVYENKVYAKNAAEFTFDTYLGETKMFRILED